MYYILSAYNDVNQMFVKHGVKGEEKSTLIMLKYFFCQQYCKLCDDSCSVVATRSGIVKVNIGN